MCAPKYNPKNKATFRQKDWISVAIACASEAEALACEELAGWCRNAGKIAQPKKSDQDMLDSVLCILVALRWRLRSRETTLFLGDLVTGYMILPASQAVRERLKKPARKHSLEMDGKVQ